MKALVFVELQDGQPKEDCLGLLDCLIMKGFEVSAVLCDCAISEAAKAQVAAFAPATLYVADIPALSVSSALPRVVLLEALCRERTFPIVAFATSVLSTEMAAILGVRLEAGLNWSLTDIALANGEVVATRASHGDAMRTTTAWRTSVGIALFRARCFAPREASEGQADVPRVAIDAEIQASLIDLTESDTASPASGSLGAAEIVVAGGRGIGKPENLELINALADALGGAVAVSLPLVEMGWAPRAMQVGQTGAVISPRLYIACGISGQIQHKIGVERSELIVAINIDRDAPIMGFCDLGVVGDAAKIVPALTALLRQQA